MSQDPTPTPVRIAVDETLVRRLIAAQFPRWAGLPLRQVPRPGWDNRTFRLGDDLLVRLPSAEPYALAVEKEQRWLPVLAPRLPLPVPVPVGQGVPGEGYPLPWSVYRWLPGETASRESIGDLTAFATGLAAFLAELGRVDPAGGPTPGLHNWYRGGLLRTYDRQTRDALRVLGDRAPAGVCRAVWDDALGAAWDGRPVWFHGDVSANNLLVRHGALAAVIDFGTCGVGDPACDLVIAWTLLSGSSRAAFRDRLAPDPGTWARGRGWALWKALITWAADPDTTGPDAADARRVLGEVLTEYAAADGG